MPELSVLLPVYNAAPFVEQAVRSIIEQSFANFECIIINDGSTDGSGVILERLAAVDSRIHLIQRENRGLVATLNQALELASAPLVARMDADDIALPRRLELQATKMGQEPDITVLGSAIRYIDSTGKQGRVVSYPQGNTGIVEALRWGSAFAHPAVMFRRDAVLKAGGYRKAFTHCEDYDLWLRLAHAGRLENLPDVLLLYRIHANNISSVQAVEQRRVSLLAQAVSMHTQLTGVDLADSAEDLPDFSDIPLSLEESARLLARMLAMSAHLIGDCDEDPQGAEWLQSIHAIPLHSETRYAMGLYHLRCARRYLRRDTVRFLRHLAASCHYSLRPHVLMLRKSVMGLRHKKVFL